MCLKYSNHPKLNNQCNWARGCIREINENDNLQFDSEQDIYKRSKNYWANG